MILKKRYYLFLMIMMVFLPCLVIGFQGCGEQSHGHSHGDSAETKVTPEGQVVGRFVEFRGPSPSGLYEMDIEIVESHDIQGAVNPTKDKVGKKITVFTMEYSEAILPGEVITAHVGLYGEEDEAILFARNLHPAVLSNNSDSSDR